MKKKYWCIALTALMLFGSALSAQAEENEGGVWNVEFTGGEVKCDFSSEDIARVINDLQPGDSVTIGITLKNGSTGDTQWYMTNQVMSSLEDSSGTASGGAYTYHLTYTDAAGEETILFSSESVGGEKESDTGVGLHEVTGSLDDYFWLDTIQPAGAGVVRLTVALDGETLNNGYQNTLAKLQMNFAVDPLVLTSDDPDSERYTTSTAVQTGDTSQLVLWSLIAFVSGILLLIMAILGFRKNNSAKKCKEEV